MSTQTTNYNLIKPSPDDDYNIEIHNGNMDKIDEKIYGIESSLGDVINYSFGVKSDINLTSEDVILQEADYCKGLLVIATAHDTNALILPNTDNHKYAIYNADENVPALIKKPSGRSIEIAPKTMVMVGYDGVDYRMIAGGGGASDATRFKPSSIDSAVGNLTVVGWDKDNNMWKAMQNGYMLYYDGYLYGNGSRVPVNGFEGDDGYKAYVQQDGSVSTIASDYLSGVFCEGGTYLILNFHGSIGFSKQYTEVMDEFFVISGGTGKIRIRVVMPTSPKVSADGVRIHRCTTEYDGSGLAWGTFVADITDDSIYRHDNEWYIDETGVFNGTVVYYTAFLYKDGVYNIANINENKASGSSGICTNEYTGDSILSTTLLDTVGSKNLNTSNLTYDVGKIGNVIKIANGGYAKSSTNVLGTKFSANLWVKRLDNDTISILNQTNEPGGGMFEGWDLQITSSNLRFVWANHSNTMKYYNYPFLVSINEWHMISIIRNGNNVKLYVDLLEIVGSGSFTPTYNSHHLRLGYSLMGWFGKDYNCDQVRLFNNYIFTTKDRENLYNQGAGC